jgi:DNA-binding protein YbaB
VRNLQGKRSSIFKPVKENKIESAEDDGVVDIEVNGIRAIDDKGIEITRKLVKKNEMVRAPGGERYSKVFPKTPGVNSPGLEDG